MALMESDVHIIPRKNTYLCLKTREIAMTPPLATFEDSALIKLALEGQTECFTVLTNRHLPAVRRRIRSIVPNTTDADDLLQEVLLKVWRHLSTFRSESTFRTWMTRVAINEALQSYRREQSRPTCQALGDRDTFASPNESPLQALTRAETTQVVRKAVVALPAKYSQVLILRDLEERSERETAQCLQSSIPAVKTRLFRARLMLLTSLRRPRNPGIDKCKGIAKPVSTRHRSEPQC
jgi:RNA polymerase sigma-70 factor (ECF subfamily)